MQVLDHIARFRSGPRFIAALSIFLICWFVGNGAWHFDAENLTLNLLLSIEAAYALPVLLMVSERRAAEESERLKEVLRATQQLIKMYHGMAEDIEDIEEKVADDR